MYFINKLIVKSIANEIYREADYKSTDNWYVVYENDNQTHDIAFEVVRAVPDEVFEFKHFVICFNERINGNNNYTFYNTNTLNRRELADKLLEVISRYETEVHI